MDIHAKQSLSQKQTLSHAQVQSLNVLAMTGDELERFLQRELEDNPLLEPPEYTDSSFSEPFSLSGHGAPSEAPEHGDIPLPDRPSLRDHLLSQLNERSMSSAEWGCMQFLIDSLSAQGFLDVSTQEVSQLLHLHPEQVSRCMARLRSLEPPGIGAHDIGDCLFLQLERLGLGNTAFDTLLHSYLEDLAAGRFSKITQEAGISKLVQRRCLEAVRHLDPHPAAAFTGGQTQYIVPDLVCSYTDGEWNIHINDRWMGSVGISTLYDRLLRSDDRPEVKAYYAERLAQAKFVLTCIEKRRATLTEIASRVVVWQSDYLLYGKPLKPLTFHQLAAAMGVHESTVSRGVRDKYIQTPRKTLPLRDLFTVSLDAEQGISQAQAMQALRKLIEEEDKHTPLSDQTLMERLKAAGIPLARRTIAKYRESLGIPSAAQRKR